MKEKFILDTSIIIDGKVPNLIRKEKPGEVIVPQVVLGELEAQASKGREEGFQGLDELKKVRKICEKQEIKLSFRGERPSIEDIRLAGSGRLDALIR
ncbi:ATPase, partial [Candidatus Bathyarchaeota archaeon]|nr:ATPase [Candidatus Bathyarchaeota archaeon]NIU80783.1 ATPase [Candidatus Bathyarchaeota archaeon]NIV67408.1 ATPase [Candidatus Bathyarchaeota archaeon]NIW15952.1 ATPase [Candidatus Bathyarchaeota archaeon]NIW34054.1 ATPase [Candidatus Bathyarchaeota archaeon]